MEKTTGGMAVVVAAVGCTFRAPIVGGSIWSDVSKVYVTVPFSNIQVVNHCSHDSYSGKFLKHPKSSLGQSGRDKG